MNIIEIAVTSTDKAGLDKIAANARRAGKSIGDGLGKGFEDAEKSSDRTERKTRENTNKMGTAFKGAVSQMTRELDKLERAAAMSSGGMSDEYASALALVRSDLQRIGDTAAKTGAGLESDLGGALRSVKDSIKDLTPAARTIDKSFETAARSVSRDLYRIEQDAWQAGKGMDKAFQSSMLELRQQLTKARTEAARTGATLESELGGALREVRNEAAKLQDTLNDGGGQSSDFMERFLGKSGAAVSAGAGFGAMMWKGIQDEWAEDKVGALIAAQSGAAVGSSERLGDVAGDAFRRNFGESVEDAGQAVTSLFQNKLIDTAAPEAAIQRLTERVLTLSATTGEEANRISSATRQMFVTGLATSVSEGMDMIQQGVENGMDVAGDLLDTIQEYSTSFREIGLNGAEAFGLINQATDAGARNTDIAADALKEFGIRAQDMSVTTARGFRTLGLDAEEMGRKVAQGGAPAKDALRQVLNALQQMPPSLERNQAAIDLFGTKAEDLGDALFSMDLDTAAKKFGDYAGSVEEAANKISEGASFGDKLGRGIGMVTDKIGEFFDMLGDGEQSTSPMINGLRALQEAKARFMESGDTTWLDEVKEKYPALAAIVDDFIEKNRNQVESSKAVTEAHSSELETLDKLIAKRQEAADGIINLADANMGWYEAIDAANAAIETNGATLDATTEKGRDNTKALYGLAEQALNVAGAMNTAGTDVEIVNGYLSEAQAQFVQTAINMGMGEEAARQLAVKLGLIPQNVLTNYNFQSSDALRALSSVQKAIDRIPLSKRTDYYFVTHATQGGGGSVRDYSSSYTGGGGRATGGISFSAATGGARHASTTVNEVGPEAIQLPDGSKVMTAGATRAMAEAGLLQVDGAGGQAGSGGPVTIQLMLDGRTLASVLVDPLRDEILRRGGMVQSVLGKGA